MLQRFFALAFVGLLLPACSLFWGQEDKPLPDKPQVDVAAMPQDPNAEQFNVKSSEELAKIDNQAQGEVFFTDPDNPHADVAGITAAFENRKSGSTWLSDYHRALRRARRDGMPVVIWFHDSAISPKSKLVKAQLLDREDYKQWLHEHAVCVMLDSGAGFKADAGESTAQRSSSYVNGLQRRYGLTRKPSFAVISAHGEVTATINGYDGYIQAIAKGIRDGVAAANKSFDAYKVRMKRQGYREWRPARGEGKLLAKVVRYDEEGQMLYLKDFTGRASKIHLSRLSAKDMQYVDEHLAKRKAF